MFRGMYVKHTFTVFEMQNWITLFYSIIKFLIKINDFA